MSLARLLIIGIFMSKICLAQDVYNIKWGTHGGSTSPLYNPFASPSWGSSPSTPQTLKDFGGTALRATGHTSSTNDFDGDLIEIGFFASSLGDDSAIGGIDDGINDNRDTPSTNLFQGTWIPLTTKTFIGQDWGDGSPSNEVVGAGQFAFHSKFTKNTDWEDYVTHNNVPFAESNYRISGVSEDTQSILSDHLAILESTNTPIGIRFYDLDITGGTGTSLVDGTSRYNTIMNSNWTWPTNSGDTLEMWLHNVSSPNSLDGNLRFEFDNTTYGDGGTYQALVAGNNVSTGTVAGAMHSDDFKTSITYWTGTSALDISGSAEDMILSGLSGSSNITGGGDNKLTLNVNGEGTALNTYTFSGQISDNGGNAGEGLEILKVGLGEQVLTGAVSLVGSANSKVTIGEGTLTLNSSSNNQQFEYFTGSGTLKLDNTAQSVVIGLANTTPKQTLSGSVVLSGSGTNTFDVGGGGATSFDKHQEFSGVVSGSANLKKTGSGKLTLSNSNTFSGGVTIADGGGAKDGGILVAGHNNALGSGTTIIEHGKLSIGAGKTVTNTIQGQATNDNANMKSVIGGGIGNDLSTGIATIDNGAGTQIDIGSGNGQIDVLSPGIAHASSMSNGTSDAQAVAGNDSALTNSIGTIQIDKIGLKNGGVFDWEIRDFDGGNSDGSDWDVLKFDTLDFSESDTFDINIYSLASNGSSGATSGNLWTQKINASGFKFMEHSGTGSGWNNASGTSRTVSGFNINSDAWAYHNDHYYGDWSVYYNDTDKSFYLSYSAVPEPSTYFMVTGLLMLPGYNFVRRFRRKKSPHSEGF